MSHDPNWASGDLYRAHLPKNNRSWMPRAVLPLAGKIAAMLDGDAEIRKVDAEVRRSALLTVAWQIARGEQIAGLPQAIGTAV
jgi:hypothetical protein